VSQDLDPEMESFDADIRRPSSSPLLVLKEAYPDVDDHGTSTEEMGRENLFSFDDLRPRRLLPSMHSNSTASSASVSEDDEDGDRLVRSEVWAKHGQPMHFITLEFQDGCAEYEYQKDSSRRLKRMLGYALVILVILNTVLMIARIICVLAKLNNMPLYTGLWICSPLGSVLLWAAQYVQMNQERVFVIRNYQEVLFVWSILHSTWALFSGHWGMSEEVDLSVGSIIVVCFICYRLRFLYFLVFGVYSFATFALLEDFESSVYIFCLIASLAFLGYLIECQQRKDFIQASIAWKEGCRSEQLLQNILPRPVIQQLKAAGGHTAIAQKHRQASILFADVVSFTTMSAQISAPTLVSLLNQMFHRLDELAQTNNVEKIKTIGDCYMAAAGLPIASPNHAQNIARFGLQLLQVIGTGILKNPATHKPIQVRVGIHSGEVMAGVLGHKKFAYDVWGDTVNTAARMESHGLPMRLHCSSDTYNLLKEDFVCEAQEIMTIKGKGEMQTYFVVSERGQ